MAATSYRAVAYRHDWRYRHRSGIAVSLLLPLVVTAFLSEPWLDGRPWMAATLDVLGWVFFLAGAYLRFWGSLYISGRKGRELVTDGPFSLCRNPLYLGTFLLMASGGLFLRSLTLLAGSAAVVLFYLAATIPVEEAALREIFGSDYLEYCRRVPRFWVRLSGFRTRETLTIHFSGLQAESRRSMLWLTIPLAGQLLVHMRAATWWPHLWPLP